jgi:hypothetical protein
MPEPFQVRSYEGRMPFLIRDGARGYIGDRNAGRELSAEDDAVKTR